MRAALVVLMIGPICIAPVQSGGENAVDGKPITVDLRGGVTMDFVWIEPGEFTMGSPLAEADRSADEGPQHQVGIGTGFYLGKCEITQAQWVAVMGTAPWTGKSNVQASPDHPAVYISWIDMQELLRRLNEAAGEELYRLPTEAEWEYACRAGTSTEWSFGNDRSRLGDYAWHFDNVARKGSKCAQPVGTKLPNPWGLYDMHGNVWEWVADWYHSESYSSGDQVNPAGATAGTSRVMRGGGFVNYPRHLRSAKRFNYDPSLRYGALGARLLMTGRRPGH